MSAERAKEAIKRALRVFGLSRLDYLALYPSQVVKVSGMLVDLVPDDQRLPTYQAVPIVLGLPGVTVAVIEGARVLLGFAGGSHKKPQAWLWESGSITEIIVTASVAVKLGASTGLEPAALANQTTAHLVALKAWLDVLVLPSAMGPAGPPAVASPSVPTLGSSIVSVKV